LVLSRSIHELIESISKERDFDFDKWENIYESIKSGRFENDKLAGTHVRDVKEYAQYANDEIQMLREFKNDIQTSSTWELMINVIYPYLFAIALGIRLSKVTFTLKEHQRHNIDT
ncbi:MAG: hypothetical protein IIA45_05840, partial [Bacteroidetes bacterium]|nr:hypothetical protein [Bacteroidota bacterium]